MILQLIRWFASKLKRRDICGEDGTLYLSRYRILGWMPGSTWRWPRPGHWNRIRETDFHYISAIQGEVWTLFIVGPKTKTWGFNVLGRGFVPWRERLRERGIDPSY